MGDRDSRVRIRARVRVRVKARVRLVEVFGARVGGGGRKPGGGLGAEFGCSDP